MKPIALSKAFAAAAGALIFALVLLFHRPAMPASWTKLHPVLTQQEVESMPALRETYREHSRLQIQEVAAMLCAGGAWLLELQYEQDATHSGP